MDEYIKKETAESVFRNARKRMKPGDYSGQEFSIRDNILLNAEQIIHLIPAADVVPGADFRDCRNELCLRCGQYKTKHLGSCDGCRWEH